MIDCWSPTSPCAKDELIGIVALEPRHFQGEAFEPAALLKMDQLRERSLSAVRLSWTTPEELKREVVDSAKVDKHGRQQRSAGVLIATVADIETIPDRQTAKAFKVTTSGTANLRGHVDIGFTSLDQAVCNRAMRLELVNAMMSDPQYLALLSTCCSSIRSRLVTHPTPSLHQSC